MMTVVATLKQQHRNVLAYMTDACQAVYTGEPAPSLLPMPPRSMNNCLPQHNLYKYVNGYCVRGGCWLWLRAVGWLGRAWSMVRVTKSCSTNSSTEDLVMMKFCKCVGILWKYRPRRVVLQTDRLQTHGSLKRATKR